MKRKATKICYACDQPATGKEHAPPSAFFPEGHRKNLITVPSCALHNNANSKDVEYARNVISTWFGVNQVGQQHFLDKAMRSFDHSPALLHTSFSDIRPVRIQGDVVGAFTTDVERVKAVMNACLTALHFKETAERITKWGMVFPSFAFGKDVPEAEVAAWNQLLTMFSQVQYQKRVTGSPEVFEYGVAEMEGGRVYALLFYKSFIVYGLREP